MQVILAKYSGFCTGVQRALKMALEAVERGETVFTLGPLAHNEEVAEYLAARGIKRVDSPQELEAGAGTLVVRTHGTTPAVYRQSEERKIKLDDATCARVRGSQQLVRQLSEKQQQIIIYGNSCHPEVVGIIGWAGENAEVISSPEELAALQIRPQAALLAQTTGNSALFEEIKEAFLKRIPGGQVYNTLCPETRQREQEAQQLAEQVEAMVVVGSRGSANTTVLYELCRRLKPACLAANAGELDWEFLRRFKLVGITAGASTPDWTIKEVVESMEMEDEKFEVEEGEQFKYQELVRQFTVGEQVTGKVISAAEDEVMLDIGYKTEAILPRAEVYLGEGVSLAGYYPAGAEIEVTVLEVDDQEGKVVVSHKRLAREKCWEELQEALEKQLTQTGKVKQVVPAGMLIDMGAGIEGFMPGSLVDLRYVPDFKQFLNEIVQFKVIELNKGKDKVILSRKMFLEEEASKKKAETLRLLEVGSIVQGVVKRLTNFGAFIDVGDIDGLAHISELSWDRIAHPQDVLKVGDHVSVKVLEVIPERDRISLSLKQAQPDPWDQAASRYTSGLLVKGKVTRLVNFGAFVELEPGLEGLVHVSQVADYHVKHPSEVLREGTEITVKILELKAKEKRISLSVKDAVEKQAPQPGKSDNGIDENPGDNGGNVTLGDVFGGLFNNRENGETSEASSTGRETKVQNEDQEG